MDDINRIEQSEKAGADQVISTDDLNNEYTEQEKEKNRKQAIIGEVIEAAKVSIPTVIITWFLFGIIFGLCFVVGPSMEPGHNDGDLMIVARNSFLMHPFSSLERGNVIVFKPSLADSKALYVKRVIGLAGDHIEINYDTKTVCVNGKVLKEPYIKEEMEASYSPTDLIVPKNCIFVMGDNRNNSRDSRDETVGCVSEANFYGKELFFIPLSKL